MRRLCAILSSLAALALGGTAWGVLGGTPDFTHTYVGAVLQHQVQNGVSGNERCSGFLISARKMITAAHCFDPSGDPIRITFDQDSRDPNAQFIQVPASSVVNSPDLDIAVITLDQDLPGPYAVLGSAPAKALVDVVGYGWEGASHKAPTDFGDREDVVVKTPNAGSAGDVFLKLSGDPGACFGDSGGPDLLPGTNVAVAINTMTNGNPNCNGVTYSLRLDNPGVQQFIAANS